MTRRLTRRAFHATTATMGAGALSEMLRVPCFENSAGAEQKDDKAKHVAGISADMPWQRQELPVLSSTTMRFDWVRHIATAPTLSGPRTGIECTLSGKRERENRGLLRISWAL